MTDSQIIVKLIDKEFDHVVTLMAEHDEERFGDIAEGLRQVARRYDALVEVKAQEALAVADREAHA